MAQGRVSITQANTGSGGINEIERTTLWIGVATETMEAENMEKVLPFNAQTDLDALLGRENSSLKDNLEVAIMNGGPNFSGYVFTLATPIANYTWDQALEFCLGVSNNIDVEMVVITDPITSANDVDLFQAAADAIRATLAKFVSVHVATPPIADDQSWAEYLAATKALQTDKVARRVYLVPQTQHHNLGAVVGRLCNTEVSIADSPMRVATGAVQGLTPNVTDKLGQPLTDAHYTDLANSRFSVPQTYPGYPGWYWSDHVSLDAPGSDYQLFENLRVIDYLSRRIRVLMIQNIANRALNRTASSIKYFEGEFRQPILDAANQGLVKPPNEEDVKIEWETNKKVKVRFWAVPYEINNSIDAEISLDLNRVE